MEMGIRDTKMARLLPKKCTVSGPVMAPVNLPMLTIEANQLLWLSLMRFCLFKFAITGEVQPDKKPICTSTRVAEI